MIRMGTVWDRTVDVLRGRGSILVALSALYVFLPNVVSGAFSSYAGPTGTAAVVGGIVALASVALLLMGMLAITAVASDPAVDMAGAHAAARARILPALGLMLLLGVVITLAAIPLGIALAAAGVRINDTTGQLDMSALDPSAAVLAGIFGLVLPIAALWLSAKIVPLFAVIVNERRGFGAFRRSFRLTRGAALRLMGLLILLLVVTIVVLLASTSVVGVVARLVLGEDGAATTSFMVAIVGALITAAVTVVQIVFYAQYYAAAVAAEGVSQPA